MQDEFEQITLGSLNLQKRRGPRKRIARAFARLKEVGKQAFLCLQEIGEGRVDLPRHTVVCMDKRRGTGVAYPKSLQKYVKRQEVHHRWTAVQIADLVLISMHAEVVEKPESLENRGTR